MTPSRIIVTGATGRMGREAVRAVQEAGDLQLSAVVSRSCAGLDGGSGVEDVPGYTDLEAALAEVGADVVIEFTSAEVAPHNLRLALEAGARPVSGTTGLSPESLDEVRRLAESLDSGAVVIPNFSLGATVLSILARTAAPYFSAAELVEMHHDGKRDAPSGTALALARAVGPRLRGPAPRVATPAMESVAAGRDQSGSGAAASPALGSPGFEPAVAHGQARGLTIGGVPVHSVRLSGLVAHHELIFAAEGETLTLRHDSISRSSFMPGVLLAVRTAGRVKGLVTSLEEVLALATPGLRLLD